MKYRIVEFQVTDEEGNSFFVQTGKRIWIKLFWIIYYPRIIWDSDITEGTNKPAGHKSFEAAHVRVEEIRKMQPIYHQLA